MPLAPFVLCAFIMRTKPEKKTTTSTTKDIKRRKAELKQLSLKLLKGVKGGFLVNRLLEGGTGVGSYHY